MSILEKHLPFVKEQIEFQQRMIDKFAGNTFRVGLHQGAKTKFEMLAFDLSAVDKALDAHRAAVPARQAQIRLSLRPEEIEGLPQELLKELSLSEGDKTEFAILGVIEETGGLASLDQIIVGLYRKTGEIIKRQTLTSKLYRMGQKNFVFNVPTKKGVYSNREITEDEALRLFGEEGPSAQAE